MVTDSKGDNARQFTENMEESLASSLLWGGNGAYLEELYEAYLTKSGDVPANWIRFFDSIKTDAVAEQDTDIAHEPIKEYFRQLSKANVSSPKTTLSSPDLESYKKQVAVNDLISCYRRFAHTSANIDPLNLVKVQELPLLGLEYHGLSNADLNDKFTTDRLLGDGEFKLSSILATLKNIYQSNIGFQYQYINNIEELKWLENRIEESNGNFVYSSATKKDILKQLTAAEGLEKYLHTKYVGQKRFSLEGAESLLVILDELIQSSGARGYKEVVLAMAHRGRLNVLVNALGKSPAELFAEFEGKSSHELASGDVKYHQGFSSDVETKGGKLHLSLAFNPSHLEIVTPVAQGSVKARQSRRQDTEQKQVLLVSIHGDSAFAGQGVVMETFNMSQLRGFSIGGTVHIVINNQVGFTTSNAKDTRSTRYCTDVAKMLEAPVFHVNGDDPESVLFVTQLALDYKNKFKKDVVIDLVCYRRHGHNEADEPSATQPLMYNIIKKLPTTRKLYADKLVTQNIITQQEDESYVNSYRDKLDQGEMVGAHILDNDQTAKGTMWHKFLSNSCVEPHDTSFELNQLVELGKQISFIPEQYNLQPQVKKVIDMRAKMIAEQAPLDWGCAEMLAYASILTQGYGLRLCGQDSGRGTFAHRHAILYDQNSRNSHNTLTAIAKGVDNNNCVVIDSFLSEEAVLAYEYGYSTTEPNNLVIWEAQFGDFANGAQVVIDQFISSGEHKWGRLSGLVLLLPHGYEGMGPEHSSARLERFLQLCAEHNMQVCVPTTPAQIFHLLRRQITRDYRKPLVVMSPKSLLRHKQAVSTLQELANGHFNVLLHEVNPEITPETVEKVVLCSGKVYYDLLAEREANNITSVAIIRIEQLYPFPGNELSRLLSVYNNAQRVVWCQEEPKNQGAWYCSAHHLYLCLQDGQSLEYVGRDSSSAPAVGYHSQHMEQQQLLVKQAIY